ncbi:MAG: GPH family glycoside/pentoside/hexuronide:cation symporter [Halieaceae bacterium]|jgi:GPH family glycoside/pentoside/hexuronide:cation symporter
MRLHARKTEIMWASGSLATGSVYNAMALFSLFFLTQVVGISPALAGSLLLVTKIYDAITDPIMGAISDRTRHKAGRRRPYLLVGSLLLGGSFALFFNVPDLTGTGLLVTVTLILLLQSTGYTVFGVPYLAMAPDIAESYDDRTRIMTLRVAFLIVGVMLGSVGGPYIVGLADNARDGYGLLGSILGAFVVVCGFVAYRGTAGVRSDDPNAISTSRESSVFSSLNDMASVFSHQPFRVLTLVKLLQLVVLALALACTPYFFQYVLERPPSDIGAYLMTFSLTGLASLPAWRVIIARFGKREVYMVSIFGYGLGLCTWWLWTPGEAEVFFYARAVGLGILSNGTLLCALSLLPDTMEFDRLASGRNREGVMSGVFTTVEKISGALGPFIIGIMLQTMGLIAGRGAVVEQPASALTAIHLGVSIVPAILCFAALPLLMRYDLGPERLREMREAHGSAKGPIASTEV